MDVSTEDGDKYVLIPATRFNRQLTDELRSDAAEVSRETVRINGGQSREVGSKEFQREGVEDRRDARAGRAERVGFWWSGGVCGQGQGDQ